MVVFSELNFPYFFNYCLNSFAKKLSKAKENKIILSFRAAPDGEEPLKLATALKRSSTPAEAAFAQDDKILKFHLHRRFFVFGGLEEFIGFKFNMPLMMLVGKTCREVLKSRTLPL